MTFENNQTNKEDSSLVGAGVINAYYPEGALNKVAFRLFPMAADTLDEILGMLKLLRLQAGKNPDLIALSKKWYDVYLKRPSAAMRLMLVGSDPAELGREIDFAVNGIPAALEKKSDWQTPLGSFFAPQPLGSQGQVCFVYPGAFNSYVGLGRDLFRYFPQIRNWMSAIASDLEYVFCERYLYPPDLDSLSKEQIAELEAALTEDAVAMMTSGMAFSVVYTYILQRVFNVQAACALGYSLGEMSMLFSAGVWVEGDKASAALAASPLFSSRLAGPMNAVRETWGMEPQESGSSQELWANYVLMAPPERVLAGLEGEKRVYLTHINTPRQVVIGGDPADCRRVIEKLKCSSLKAPFSYALHCDAMKSAYQGFRDLNLHPIKKWPEMRLYSAADYATYQPVPDEIAHKVAFSLCTHLDFPRLLKQAYDDGARIFIEVGAGGNCAKWIDDSLRGQPTLAISINRKGTDDAVTLIRTLARLASHRVPVNLEPLYS
jgi:PfaB family protein